MTIPAASKRRKPTRFPIWISLPIQQRGDGPSTGSTTESPLLLSYSTVSVYRVVEVRVLEGGLGGATRAHRSRHLPTQQMCTLGWWIKDLDGGRCETGGAGDGVRTEYPLMSRHGTNIYRFDNIPDETTCTEEDPGGAQRGGQGSH